MPDVKTKNIADRIAHLESSVADALDAMIDLAAKLNNFKSDTIKTQSGLNVRICSLEERDRFQRNAAFEASLMSPPKAEPVRIFPPRLSNIDQVRRAVVEGTQDAWIVLSGSPLKGFEVEGPFSSEAEAQCWGEDMRALDGFFVSTLR